jgi:hypothetical protein
VVKGILLFFWLVCCLVFCMENIMFQESDISIELERWLGGYFSLLFKFLVISYWQNVIQVNYSSTWLICIYSDQYYLFRLKSLFLDCIDHVDNSCKLLWNISNYLPFDMASYPRRLESCYIVFGRVDNGWSPATFIIAYHKSPVQPYFFSLPYAYFLWSISFPSVSTKV